MSIDVPHPPPPPPGPLTTPPPLLLDDFVVILHTHIVHPIVRVIFLLVEYDAAESHLSMTESQRWVVPLSEVNAQPLILYSPPVTDIAVCHVMPDTMMALDVYIVENSVFDSVEKLNPSGMVSAGYAKAKSER
jgi:hypothetical protein